MHVAQEEADCSDPIEGCTAHVLFETFTLTLIHVALNADRLIRYGDCVHDWA